MSGIPDPGSAFDKADSNNAIAGRDPKTGQFLPGRKGVGGRKRGSRSKLAEDVVTDVLDSWRQHGAIVLERLACLDPAKYADFIAKVLPREVKVEHSITDGLSDEELERMIEIAERMAGGVVIDGQMRNVTPPPIPAAPPTSAEQRAEAQRRDMLDQHDALAAAAPALPSQALPHSVGRAVPLSAREAERRNIAKLHEDDINPEDLF